MANIDHRSVVRLGKTQRSDSGVIVLSRERKPVFVDEVEDVFLPLQGTRPHSSRSGKFIAIFLIPMLLLQPFVKVYAAEEVVAAQDERVATAVEISVTESAPPSDTVAPPVEETTANTTLDTQQNVEGTESSDGVSATSPEQTEGASTPVSQDPDTVPLPTDSETSSSTARAEESATTTTGESSPNATSTSSDDVSLGSPPQEPPEVVPSESPPEEVSPAPDLPPPEDPPPGINIDQILREHEESMRAELRKQVEQEYAKGCVSLDNVGYYCLKGDAPKFTGDLTPSDTISDVTAEVNDGSDKEIFATRKGERIQLSSNDWEDAFPARDLSGRSVVWQGQNSGRWQIFYATFASATPKIVQLTQGSESNFNPKVEGNTIVWQSWVDNNWEIYMARPHKGDRDPEEPLPEDNLRVGVGADWDVNRITSASAHDMFPSIANDVITWQRSEDSGWSIYAYSVTTGVTTRVSDVGIRSENPRFALVWEEGNPDGSRRLVGYNLATGELEDLTRQAQQAPYQRPYTPASPVSASNDQAAMPSTTNTAVNKTENDGGDGSDGDGGDDNANSTDQVDSGTVVVADYVDAPTEDNSPSPSIDLSEIPDTPDEQLPVNDVVSSSTPQNDVAIPLDLSATSSRSVEFDTPLDLSGTSTNEFVEEFPPLDLSGTSTFSTASTIDEGAISSTTTDNGYITKLE